MLEEMKTIEENKTWKLIDPPLGCRPISLKWVYNVKWDELGAIVKHKARLVVRGFIQREGIDFEEVFAPVARMVFGPFATSLGSSKGLARPSPGRKISLPQRRAGGDSLCQATSEFRRQGRGAQGAPTAQDALRAAACPTSMERQA